MQKIKLLIVVPFILLFIACNEENNLINDPFVVGFSSLSINLLDLNEETALDLEYSRVASSNGLAIIEIKSQGAIYGQDFTTLPEAENNRILLSINQGDTQNKIVFKKLGQTLDEKSAITFEIVSLDIVESSIQGNTKFTISSTAALGGTMAPNVGGPNQPNQVYVDLSTQKVYEHKRNVWDLGFYSGDQFRVTINGSVYMAAKALNVADIDAVSEQDINAIKSTVAVGTFDADNLNYIDHPDGSINKTAIDEVSISDSENKVYLLNLGYSIGVSEPNNGSVAIANQPRGWKKVRILRDGNGYKLQYADINDTTHQEINITKDSLYNFTHFSFETNQILNVEPPKEQWDISFTVFTNNIEGSGSYGFSDFVTLNSKGNIKSYQVDSSDLEYTDFSFSDIQIAELSNDQSVIGDSWRDVFKRIVFDDRYYILQDSNSNLYKIKFITMTDVNGVRGYPKFEYQLLQ